MWDKKGSSQGQIPDNKVTLDKLSDDGTKLLFNGAAVFTPPTNKATLDKLSDSGTQLLYNGQPIASGGSVTVPSKWTNGKGNFVGDSITDGSGGSNYRQYVVSNLGLALGRNYGISGTTVSNINQPFYNRVATMNADADFVTVLGGTNDFSLNCELGTLYTTDGNGLRTATTDLSTFFGAYHQLAKNLVAKFPTKRIVLITPLHRGNYVNQPNDFKPNTKGYYLRDFVNAVIEIGKWYGFPVCDMYTLSNMTPNESAQNTLYFSDQLHPTDLGYRRLADVLSAFLNTL